MTRVGKALLILNLQLLLVYPNFLQPKVDRGVKTQDQYWRETGLGSKELETLVSDANCRLDEISFLACVNALTQMSERLNLVFQFDGTFIEADPKSIAQRLTEKQSLSPWENQFVRLRDQLSFLKAFQELDQKYLLKNQNERAQIIAAGLNGFLSIFKDPHSYLMPVALYEEVIAQSDSRLTHSGIIARRNADHLMVQKVFPQSAAAIAGLKRGDRIMSLNATAISHLVPSRISDLLKLKGISVLNAEVLRNGRRFFALIEKTTTPLSPVSSEVINGKNRLGLLAIHKFSKGVCGILKNEVQKLQQSQIRGILLDLRDNPGGQVDEAACVANIFLDQGTFLFETRYLDSSRPSDQYFAEDEKLYAGPVAILVNSGSASASEIVAGTLKDYQRAQLVGERTFGKGSFQDGKVWQANPKIALFETEGFYYFASGWTPQLVGLQPDIEVQFNSTDNYREQESFIRPLIPNDSWSGPQSISWLLERECQLDAEFGEIGTSGFIGDDPQIAKAQALMNCGVGNDRNGSL